MFLFPQNSAAMKRITFLTMLTFGAAMMLLSLADQKVITNQECYIKTNGCSIPGDLPFFYKKPFTPACVSHDVCYSCVRIPKQVIFHHPFPTYRALLRKCFYHVSFFCYLCKYSLAEIKLKSTGMIDVRPSQSRGTGGISSKTAAIPELRFSQLSSNLV